MEDDKGKQPVKRERGDVNREFSIEVKEERMGGKILKSGPHKHKE